MKFGLGFITFLFVFCILSSCSQAPKSTTPEALKPPEVATKALFERKIASESPAQPQVLEVSRKEVSLLSASEQVIKDILNPQFPVYCRSYLHELISQLEKIKIWERSQSELSDDGSELAYRVWLIRTTLHSRLSEIPSDCISEVRTAFRILRFSEEYLAENKKRIQHLQPEAIQFDKIPVPIKDRAENYFELRSPQYSKDFAFRSGDVMITRGLSFLSSMIARVGDVQSQFSHVVLVHVDEKTGEVNTIESYLGIGVKTYPIDEALRNENSRIVVLRPKDSELGKRAAQLMFDRTREGMTKGKLLHYDYQLDFQDHSAYSCAEVAQVGYEEASGGAFRIPLYPSHISGTPQFLERVDLRSGDTFTPGDLEVDPRFELVLDWRDLSLTRDSRHKDAIFTVMFEWMQNRGYQLYDTGKSKMAGRFVWPARRTFVWPLVRKMLGLSDFSKEIPKKTFQNFALLNEVGETLLAYLREADRQFEQKQGWAMSYVQMYEALEEFRQKDFENYYHPKTRKKSLFHRAFRPGGLI